MAGAQPAGTYKLRITDNLAAPCVVMGWLHAEIILELVREGRVIDLRMEAQELYEALVHDGDQETDPPANPGIAKRRPKMRFSRAC
jgi:hypothetical protein